MARETHTLSNDQCIQVRAQSKKLLTLLDVVISSIYPSLYKLCLDGEETNLLRGI
jgi:hypothetical protein